MGIAANSFGYHMLPQAGKAFDHRGLAEQCVRKDSGETDIHGDRISFDREFTFDQETGQNNDCRKYGYATQALAKEPVAVGGKDNPKAGKYQYQNNHGARLHIIEAEINEERVEQADCNEDQANTLIIF